MAQKTVGSTVFIVAILGFTILDPLLKVKVVQNFLGSEWLNRGSVLMTLIVGYTFVIARLRHGITLKDSNISYKKGQKAVREDLRDWVDKKPGTNLSKQDVLDKLKEVDEDP